MSYTFTTEEFQRLDDKQKDAVLDVIIAGCLADGQLVDAEVSRFDSEIRKVPWGHSEAEMDAKIKASFEKINGFTDPQQAIDLVKSAAAALTDPTIREKTFHLLATVMYADNKMTQNEKTVLTAFAVAFQIPVPKLAEISQAVKKGS